MGDEKQLAGNSSGSAYAKASLKCDIVMKGGITSGVVYPHAVTELAKRYKFCSIGGTSAGAIAAAVVAAAEHNRDGGGFKRVEALPGKLGDSSGGQPFMLQLFAPDRATRTLFEAALGFMRNGKLRGALGLLRFWRASVPAALLVLAALAVCIFAGASALWLVVAVLAALLLLIVVLGVEAAVAARTLAKNDFGLCHLGPDAGTAEAPALTPWLHEEVQAAAGLTPQDPDTPPGPPLTFADLWGIPRLPDGAGDDLREARASLLQSYSTRPRLRNVDLQVMTTSLSHGRPLRLPAPFQKHDQRLVEGGGLLFDEDEMRRFFPEVVVEHLRDFGADPSDETAAHLRRVGRPNLRHFPIGPDLPVIVATRMSLSFPILISALSLWEFDYAADSKRPPLKRVVFSDGGITSNFPIHFFDSPAPTRPTFGLQLTGFEAGDGPIAGDPAHSVEDPPAPNARARELRSDMHDLFGFLTAVKDAMQNWRDNAQSRLPGYRDRIVRLKMARGEGGMNLAMTEEKIKELTKRGEVAGAHLVSLFSGPPGGGPAPTEQWDAHRWARFRMTMSGVERFLQDFAYGYKTPPKLAPPYADRIWEGTNAGLYPLSATRRDAALDRSKRYSDLAAVTDEDSLDDANVPRPPATLRSVPPV